MTDDQWEIFKRQIGQCVPIGKIQFEPLTDKQQEELLEIIQGHQNNTYNVKIIKRLSEYELLDKFYELLTEYLSTNYETHVKTFYLPDGDKIYLKENSAFISQGTTGLCTWSASLYLLEYLLTIDVSGKDILELGSGAGLLGIALARKNNVLLTDVSPLVIERLNENIAMNNSIAKADYLDWENPDSINFKPDITLCADVIFNPCLIRPLFETIKRFSNVCYISSTKRNQETFDVFFSLVKSENIQYEIIDFKSEWFYLPERDIVLLKLDLQN
ncbi:Protein fam86a [Boothiomyces sp. JEL0838]|nr:Protein fam86a [Boothiomyces sp. JEL0838]KAJ3313159.1 Protein fam86a [Boothiomyces sp. JEL0838]